MRETTLTSPNFIPPAIKATRSNFSRPIRPQFTAPTAARTIAMICTISNRFPPSWGSVDDEYALHQLDNMSIIVYNHHMCRTKVVKPFTLAEGGICITRHSGEGWSRRGLRYQAPYPHPSPLPRTGEGVGQQSAFAGITMALRRPHKGMNMGWCRKRATTRVAPTTGLPEPIFIAVTVEQVNPVG